MRPEDPIAPCPPWSLRAWPPVLWQVGPRAPMWPAPVHHRGTHVLPTGNAEGPRSGQTLWVGRDAQGDWGLAWDWVEIANGVLALADPMAVVSNLRLVSAAGEPLPTLEAARHFSGLVHTLPWQHEVGRAVSRRWQ